MPDKHEHDKPPHKVQSCQTVGSQDATICVPVKVCPYAVSGPIKIKCCGEPVVQPSCEHCRGNVNGTCEFTISQKISVDIPVKFGASVNVGETFVDCGCAKGDVDHDCGCHHDKEDEDGFKLF